MRQQRHGAQTVNALARFIEKRIGRLIAQPHALRKLEPREDHARERHDEDERDDGNRDLKRGHAGDRGHQRRGSRTDHADADADGGDGARHRGASRLRVLRAGLDVLLRRGLLVAEELLNRRGDSLAELAPGSPEGLRERHLRLDDLGDNGVPVLAVAVVEHAVPADVELRDRARR